MKNLPHDLVFAQKGTYLRHSMGQFDRAYTYGIVMDKNEKVQSCKHLKNKLHYVDVQWKELSFKNLSDDCSFIISHDICLVNLFQMLGYTPPGQTTPLSVNRITNRCKNITLPQTSFTGGNYL